MNHVAHRFIKIFIIVSSLICRWNSLKLFLMFIDLVINLQHIHRNSYFLSWSIITFNTIKTTYSFVNFQLVCWITLFVHWITITYNYSFIISSIIFLIYYLFVTMTHLSCSYCDQIVVNNNDLIKHEFKCSVLLSTARRTQLWRDNVCERFEIAHEYDEDHVFYHDIDVYQSDHDSIEKEINEYRQSRIKECFEILSISSFVRFETYEEVIDRKTKSTINEVSTLNEEHDRDENLFYSFINERNYALAHWFHEFECTKKNVNRFFRDERFVSMHEELSFNNADEWLNQLNRIHCEFQSNVWKKTKITLNQTHIDDANTIAHVQSRDVVDNIRFLLNHESFDSYLFYTSIRQFNDENERIYIEMHTKNWWWKTQKKLSFETTIVSLFIVTDKTMLTQHHDDTTTWFVYLTIENLNREIRRSQTRFDNMFIEFIFIVKISESNVKANVWHEVLFMMMKRKFASFYVCLSIMKKWFNIAITIKKILRKNDILIKCANFKYRRCFSIIADFICDYEKQIIIIEIKNEQHCIICRVSLKARKNLMIIYSYRTHEWTQHQIQQQKNEHVNKTNDDWIHEISNFAWKHDMMNIHEIMMLNVLHQLLKDMIMHVIT